jgi:anthranilate synthase component I
METIRPFRRTLLADLETPVTAYLKLSEKAPVSFLLESVERGRQSRFSIVGVGRGAPSASRTGSSPSTGRR